MQHILTFLLAALQLFSPLSDLAAQRLHSGQWLRLHVVAHDDTSEMQRVKLCVRDAVQACYLTEKACGDPAMLDEAQRLLPLLTDAAISAARAEGFEGAVAVSVETVVFDERMLDSLVIPAGEYPALMIRLGDAQGHNWWGLLDPELSLTLAATEEDAEATDDSPVWDWSWRGFLAALLGRSVGKGE